MTSIETTIREKFDRIVKAFATHPEIGRNTHVSVTRIDSHMSCETVEGEYHLKTDMPEAAGGRGVSPPPGVFGRANLGSCLSMGYMLRAAHQGIKIRSLEVEIQCDDDEGGLFGPDQQQAGYSEIRYMVRVDTDLDDDALSRFLDECDAHSPSLDNYSRAIPCVRSIERTS